MSNRIPFQKIGEVHLQAADFARAIQKAEVLSSLTTGELKEIKESIDCELNFRENQRSNR